MRKIFVLLLWLLFLPCLQAGLTTVTQLIRNADGSNFQGYLIITWPSFKTSAGETVVGSTVGQRFPASPSTFNGTVTLALYPTQSATPSGVSYRVRFISTTSNVRWEERWDVVISTPTDVDTVRISTSPTPTALIQLRQLAQGGATDGQDLRWNNTTKLWTPMTLFDSVNPAAIGTVAPGTQVIASRRDHVHSFGALVNSQTGVSYTVLDGDRGKLVTISNASPVAVTLPQAGASSQFVSGWVAFFENRGAGTVTITPTTSTIDGASSLALTSNLGAAIFSDGTNYYTLRGMGGNLHALLSSTHTDTTPASPVRGDGLFAIGASPTWQRLAHSSATGGYYKWNGTDMVASTLAASGTGSCTNQVPTALNADAAPTCTTITSAYVNTSIAQTGVDINTSHQVTATHLSSPLPIAQGGTALTTAPAQEMSFPAGICNNATAATRFDLPTSAAATITCFGTTTTQTALDFVDASTTGASLHFRLPVGWTGNVDIILTWFANASSSNAVRWSVSTGCVADSEAISTGPSYNSASATNAAYTGTANQRQSTTLSAVAVTNCSAGETMYVQVQRIGGDAGDTLTATAELLDTTVRIRITPQA